MSNKSVSQSSLFLYIGRGSESKSSTKKMMKRKHLSAIANDVVERCAKKVETSVDKLVEEFEAVWTPELGDYSRKFVEFCSFKALSAMCQNISENICNGSFSRLSFDMMIAWENPSATDKEQREGFKEGVAKEKEEKTLPKTAASEQDDTSLFYTDLMPLLVDDGASVGDDAFVWLGSLVPLAADVANGRFTFETLTAPTSHRLHYPAYDKFLREIDKCVLHLQKQTRPRGVEMADDEYILHVEGTSSTQRVVRHIGGTSWPGRLTLTNYALYFEASGVINYENALKIDLSKDIEHNLKAAATGPWGAPLFDKAIVYETPELSEGIVLEFPEITSSTRRDHWLALMKEIMLMHQFMSKYKVESPIHVWEMHSRTILGIIRLHAAREMLKISPPDPTKFLIFALFDELPKGDYVLEGLAESLKKVHGGHPCSASSIIRSINVSKLTDDIKKEVKEVAEESKILSARDEEVTSLGNAIDQVREEARETNIAKATTEVLKEEGISESVVVLMELLKPLKGVLSLVEEALSWEEPMKTLTIVSLTLFVIYMEWAGKAIAACLLWIIAKMLQARKEKVNERSNEIVVYSGSDQSTMESIVSAQRGLQTLHEMVQTANITLLRIWSIFISKAPKHANMVMVGTGGVAVLLALIPFKIILMGSTLYLFIATSKLGKNKQSNQGQGGGQGERRLKEWWDSIPVSPVRVINEIPDKPK